MARESGCSPSTNKRARSRVGQLASAATSPTGANLAQSRVGSLASNMATRLSRALAKLTAAKQKIAIAETSAGGLIAATLLAQPGASKYFAGAAVCYTKGSKQAFLGLEAEKSKPTSTEPHAVELANAVRDALGSEWAIGETGVAGPTPNSRGISPGVCALAIVGPDGLVLRKTLFPDDTLSDADAYGQPPKVARADAMKGFGDAAIELLCDAVDKQHPDA